jgi:hypothetical protein
VRSAHPSLRVPSALVTVRIEEVLQHYRGRNGVNPLALFRSFATHSGDYLLGLPGRKSLIPIADWDVQGAEGLYVVVCLLNLGAAGAIHVQGKADNQRLNLVFIDQGTDESAVGIPAPNYLQGRGQKPSWVTESQSHPFIAHIHAQVAHAGSLPYAVDPRRLNRYSGHCASPNRGGNATPIIKATGQELVCASTLMLIRPAA